MTQHTQAAMPVANPTIGITPVIAKMHMARPRARPKSLLAAAKFLFANSFRRDLDMLLTTINCHTRLNRGISKSHTVSGDMVLDSTEHRSSARWRVNR